MYELDGLQEGPIEIGRIPDSSNWIDTVKGEIQARMQRYQEGTETSEIRFNLLSMKQDPTYEVEMDILKARYLRQNANIKLVSFGEEVILSDEVDEDGMPDGVPGFEELSDGRGRFLSEEVDEHGMPDGVPGFEELSDGRRLLGEIGSAFLRISSFLYFMLIVVIFSPCLSWQGFSAISVLQHVNCPLQCGLRCGLQLMMLDF